MSILLHDPWFTALIDDSIRGQGLRFTPSQIEAFREAMAFTFTHHPTARRILAKARPDLDLRLPSLDLDLEVLSSPAPSRDPRDWS